MKRVDYNDRQHAVYAKGRAMSSQATARWMAAFAAQAPQARPLSVVDLGSGTGRFTPALAETFGGPVYGVEPSERMRAIAEADATHPDVRYLAGEAANIPLADGSADVVLMFLSFHHFPDRGQAAREIARVLRPGGCVLLRSTFAGRVPDLWWRPFFPRTWDIEEAVFPSVAELAALFAAVGLPSANLVEVEQRFEDTLAEEAARLRLRAISIFEHLEEAELAEGFARMDAALARGEAPPPPTSGLRDLLVLRREPSSDVPALLL